MICWVSTFIALTKLLPASFSAFSYSLVPVLALPMNYFLRNEKIKQKEIIASLVIFFGLLLIGHFEFTRRMSDGFDAILIGLISSLITALAATATIVYGRRLNDKGIKSNEIFQHRFWFILIIGIVWLAFSDIHLPENYMQKAPVMLSLGIMGIAAPLLCLQYAIQKKGPVMVGAFFGAVPVTVLFLQYMTGIYSQMNFVMSAGISFVCFGILLISIKLPKAIFAKEKLN